MQTNFCNRRDSTGTVQFSPFVVGFGKARQIEWMENELALGSTHMTACVDFNGYGVWDHPDKPETLNFYHANRGDDFRTIMLRMLHRGLTPIVFLHHGDFYAGADYYRGVCAWWNRHCADLTDQCIFVNGWETRRFGGHRAAEFNESNLIMRDLLGPSAIIAFHGSPESGLFGSGDPPREDDDPWAYIGEQENWEASVNAAGARLCGPEIDILLFQNLRPEDDRQDDFGQPLWWDRLLDTAERFLEAGSPMPGAATVKMRDRQGNLTTRDGYAGGPHSADWFGGTHRQRGRPTVVAFETVAPMYIRGEVDDARVLEVNRIVRSFGFTLFGNGRP